MSAPRIGPRQLVALRLIAEHGPKTPRELGAALHPDVPRGADGIARVAGVGRGKASDAGKANKGAGAMLGHMARAGWVRALGGERFHVAYEVTDKGRAALEDAARALEADPLVGPHDPVPEGRHRCRSCSRARPLAMFHRDSSFKEGRSHYCGRCRLEQQAERRAARMETRDVGVMWRRCSREVLEHRVMELLRVTRDARRVGTWRGRDGLRAYAALGAALAVFDSGDDAKLSVLTPVDAHDNEPAHHADPRDAEWSRAQHATPARYRAFLGAES